MNQTIKTAIWTSATMAVFISTAVAQSPKELKAKSGTSILVVTLLNPKPDCSATPGPVAVPLLREKPANGLVQMQVVAADVPASDKCPARKVASIALVYTSKKDFAGTDSIQIEVEVGNRTTYLSYRITVQPTAEPL